MLEENQLLIDFGDSGRPECAYGMLATVDNIHLVKFITNYNTGDVLCDHIVTSEEWQSCFSECYDFDSIVEFFERNPVFSRGVCFSCMEEFFNEGC